MKRIICLILSLGMMFGSFNFALASEQGTDAENPILIYTADDLKNIAKGVESEDKFYKLANNIDLGEQTWTSYIGTVAEPFCGDFNGNGFVIRNYRMQCSNGGVYGLFGVIGGNGKVYNLGVENVIGDLGEWDWAGVEACGGIAGVLEDSASIKNCYAKSVTLTRTTENTNINYCEFKNGAGIVGKVTSADVVVENCYAIDCVKESVVVDYNAGLIGNMQVAATVRNCYSNTSSLRCHSNNAVNVSNVYYTDTNNYAQGDECYAGIVVSDDEIKRTAEALGDAFCEDVSFAQINDGYPILVWQLGEKFSSGDATIVASAFSAPMLSVEFDKYLKKADIDEDFITVTPDAEFSIEASDAEYVLGLNIIFDNLMPQTQYTVTFEDTVETYAGDTVAEGQNVVFTTPKGFSNLIINGDMEDTSSIGMFNDSLGGSQLSYIKDTELKGVENSVLRISPLWADQPVVALDAATDPGTYYMSAWVKSEIDQNVSLTFLKIYDRWDSIDFELKAGEWTYLAAEFITESDGEIEQISIRPKSIGNLYIDDWCLYDVTVAPNDDPIICNSSVSDGDSEIPTMDLNVEVEFNVPVRFETLSNITLEGDAGQIEDILFDAKEQNKCTIAFSRLDASADYELVFDGVKSIFGKTIQGQKIAFTTVDVNGRDANVVSTSPANGETEVRKNNLEIEIVFDSPIEPGTEGGITVTPDLGAKAKIAYPDIKKCIIYIDQSKFENGKIYTVTIPDTVKTIDGYLVAEDQRSFSFTTVTDASLVSEFSSGLGNAQNMEAVMEDLYPELRTNSKAYDYILENMQGVKDELYTRLSHSAVPANAESVLGSINATAFMLLAENLTEPTVIEEILSGDSGVITEGVEKIFAEYLNPSYRKSVSQTALDMSDKTYNEVVDVLTTKIICGAFKCISGADAVRNILNLSKSSFTGQNDITELLSKAEAYSVPSKIYISLQELSVNNLSEIKAALTAAVNAAYNQGSNQGGGGGGGAGGGSSQSKPQSTQTKPSGVPSILLDDNSQLKNDMGFYDIDSVEWAKDSILRLYKEGIISGKEKNKFAPSDMVTRAEFVRMAMTILGETSYEETNVFTDVNKKDWYYSSVMAAYQRNIVSGQGDGFFGASNTISREDMAVILLRIMEYSNVEASGDSVEFADFDLVSDYAKNAVETLGKMGVISGMGDGTFAPKAVATRAQAAVIFDRFMKILETE